MVFVHICLLLQLARSCRAPAVAKNRKCKHAASQSRQRPGSVPAAAFSVQKKLFFFPENGFEAKAARI